MKGSVACRRPLLLQRAATAMAAVIERAVTDYADEYGYDPDDPETREACRADLLAPANQLLCEVCGWTLGMICPECAKGCGCETSCSGWRHDEWGIEDDDAERVCQFCGDYECDGSGYNCDDGYYQTYNLPDDAREGA